jgi:hypothetical protein
MFRMAVIAFAVIGVSSVSSVPARSEAAKCTSMSARCAVEIGGTCDPATGRWQYGRAGIGGTNKYGAFDACIARKLKERR